jgi:hypothetical protein
MKAYRLSLAIALALVASAVFVIVPDPAFAAGLIQDHALAGLGSHLIEATVALTALRARHAELSAKVTAKAAEIKDGMAEADVRRIESEHETLVAEAAEVQRQITDAETEERSRAPAGPDQEAVRAATAAATAAAIAAERTRVAELQVIARQGNIDADVLQKHITDGTTVENFRKIVLDLVAARSQEGAGTGTRVEITRDEVETRRTGMTQAIVARMARAAGERNVQIPEVARRYGEMGLVEMAAEVVGYRGLLRTGRQADEALKRAFLSTSDFPAIFMDAMNVRLLARYQTQAPTYRLFCARYVNPDFRAANVIRAGDFPALQPVGQNGEIKHGSFGESKEQLKVDAYAVQMSISRVMIINDQLAAIDQVLGSAGVRVTDWENVKAFEKLVEGSGAGPLLLTDNKRVFHSDHGNLAGSGTVIDVTNIGLARAAMRKQKTLDGMLANFQPKILLTGPDKETQAEQLLTSITPATNATAVPESMRKLMPVADGNLSGNAWYLFADPAVAPCFHYGYLEGYEGPRMTSEEEFGVQGLKVKLEHDFGVAGTDFRGAYRNAGA